MAPGVTLAVIGAIFAFAVRADPTGINLRMVGLIFMIAGIGLIWHARAGSRRKRIITRVQDPQDVMNPQGTVRETIEEQDIE